MSIDYEARLRELEDKVQSLSAETEGLQLQVQNLVQFLAEVDSILERQTESLQLQSQNLVQQFADAKHELEEKFVEFTALQVSDKKQ